MKTLRHHTLLYDTACPLCCAYTSSFITHKMLDAHGRQPFETLATFEQDFIDVERAADEIALVDTKHQKVYYGIDSLLKVIGNAWPWGASIAKTKWIYWMLKKLYALISFNRKVIVPSIATTQGLSCTPRFNLKYRLIYILLSVFAVGYSLYCFSNCIMGLPQTNWYSELGIGVGQIVFQSVFLIRKKVETIWNYIGHLMTVSLMGSGALGLILLLHYSVGFSQPLLLALFAAVVGGMFYEHKRRITILKLPYYITYTWIAYRVLVLGVLVFIL